MYIAVLALFSQLAQSCPDSCYCETDTVECIIESCDIDIILDIPILILYGGHAIITDTY